MFEINVEDIFSITGRGTVFVGRILSGKISVGDPALSRVPWFFAKHDQRK